MSPIIRQIASKKRYVALAALLALAGGTLLALRLMTTERGRVTRVVRHLARRLEQRDAPAFCSLLTEDYHDACGHRSRADLRGNLTRWLPFLGSVAISLEDLDIKITGDAATADLLANATASARGYREEPPWRWKTRVRLRLRKSEGEWRVCEAEYRLPARVDFD